jgi:hypothetical protein
MTLWNSLWSSLTAPLPPTQVMFVALLIQTFCTFAMTGLIWLIQGVHYPLLAKIGPSEFTEYVHLHARNITYIVGPLMMIEVMTALACLYWAKSLGVPAWVLWAGLALLFVIWAATAFLSVPCHDALSRGYDLSVIYRLVDTNWIRTVAWTIRSGLLLWTLWLLLSKKVV